MEEKIYPVCNEGNEHFVVTSIKDYLKRGIAMTPSEELFAKLFNGHNEVLSMSDLDLRAHREEMARIAFEARAYVARADDEEKQRKNKKRESSGARGFERNLNIDETSSNAINAIKERQKKLTKMEKIQADLVKWGVDPKEAEKITSARNIKAHMDAKTIQNHTPVNIPITENILTETKAETNTKVEKSFDWFKKE